MRPRPWALRRDRDVCLSLRYETETFMGLETVLRPRRRDQDRIPALAVLTVKNMTRRCFSGIDISRISSINRPFFSSSISRDTASPLSLASWDDPSTSLGHSPSGRRSGRSLMLLLLLLQLAPRQRRRHRMQRDADINDNHHRHEKFFSGWTKIVNDYWFINKSC